jgi:hypothetical protein
MRLCALRPWLMWVMIVALMASQLFAVARWAMGWGDLLRAVATETTVEDLWREEEPRLSSSIAANMDLADWLRAETSATDTVWVWGCEPLINFRAERMAPTRFLVNTWLLAPWHESSWDRELIEDLRRAPPTHIVVCHNDAIPWVTGVNKDSAFLLTEFEALSQLMQENYRPVWSSDLFTVHRRRL